MKREKFFRNFYGYFEVLVDLSSGTFMLAGTGLFLQQYIPTFETLFDSPATFLLARSFGLMVIISGFLQYAIIQFGNRKTRIYGLIGLVIGDLLQIIVSGIFISNFSDWTFLHIFNMIFTPGLVISRLYFLFTGVPEPLER